MIRSTEQILNFNNEIKSTHSIKQLDNLYTKIVCSELDDAIVEVFKDMIELTVKNMQIKGFADN